MLIDIFPSLVQATVVADSASSPIARTLITRKKSSAIIQFSWSKRS